ncbi:hypothetical protein [Halapricum desulfuricans]|uniref:Uncharacterized protein n=1 Tax=Halapricum desulfuricans TaxID=2841257 RepID=A0A897NPL0_9EURY|nr:hypothetical protein [Halapricum desulfuricans]QSG14374.1 hypothetical protein HSEST_0830 [Halapricum desulfuricans]
MSTAHGLAEWLEDFFNEKDAGIEEITVARKTLYIEADVSVDSGESAAATAAAMFNESGWPDGIQEVTIKLIDGDDEEIMSVFPEEIHTDELS